MRLTLQERFWRKVDKTPGHGPQGDCWLWTGRSKHRFGYGWIGVNGKNVNTHRVSYEIAFGEIPPGLCVLHRCDVGECVRPDHLFLGTGADNMADRDRKNRQAKGKRQGTHTKPESRATGDRHWSRLYPDAILRGERCGAAKLTAELVRLIRETYDAGGISLRALGRRFGVRDTTIGDVVHGRTWKTI